ncbi:unnamed protein product [Lymnaea stagnalis]|uniref:G-protein coupled receptors family 1 profile domain-containing protein n=1 Tax=Lymnaea stagnalis TaxID=6523 RepID=A0AAV2HWZ2_LYMST
MLCRFFVCLQGFKDTVNISLLGLAISDLMSLVTSLWVSICWNPLMYYADLPFIPGDVEYLTGSIPHLIFTRVTGWITAFVAFERCLCIALPLRVKTIVTPRRATWLIVAIFILVGAAHSTAFYTTGLDAVFDAARNRTLLGLVARPRSDEINSVSYSVNLVSPFGSFVLVLVCTAVTSAQLRQKSAWRVKSVAGTALKSTPGISGKDQKIIKMVVVISIVFIVSYLPANVMHMMYCTIADEPSLVTAYWTYMSVAFSFIKVLEAVNASVSIVLYYTMSSRYRAGFWAIFGKGSDDTK